jgi:formylglycine-generating enzyme required for sulfatase activity
LLQLYRDDPDPGIHGAAEWLLRQWQAADALKGIDNGLATGKVEGRRQWHLNRQGQTMMLVARPGTFWMGEGAEGHRRRIDRNFAIASKEVTIEQFLKFRQDERIAPQESRSKRDCPVTEVSWYLAAGYCNWLSEQEGIPEDQWCYRPNETDVLQKGLWAEGMQMAPNYLERTG